MSELVVDQTREINRRANDTKFTVRKSRDEEEGYTALPSNEIPLLDVSNDNVMASSVVSPDDDENPTSLPTEEDEDDLLDESTASHEFGRYSEHGELTVRAIVSGCLIGILVGAMNINFGLRTGWTQGGNVFAAIIAIGVFSVIKPLKPYTKYETVITVTAASSAGTMTAAAGLVSSIPALKLLGNVYSVWELYAWAFAIAFFGVYFAVPLRKQMLIVEKLRFPSGTASAMTIKAMFAQGAETLQKAYMLMYWGIGTSIFSIVAYFISPLSEPPMPSVLMKWGFTLYVNPLLIGGGMLSGPRACVSLFLGSICGWGIIGPIIDAKGWVEDQGNIFGFNGVRGWILWVGVAIMTSESIVQIVFTLKIVAEGFVHLINRVILFRTGVNSVDELVDNNRTTATFTNRDTRELNKFLIPSEWWIVGLVISTIVVCFVGHFIFNLKFYFILLALPISAVLSIIATRCVGETDINPIGGMGKVTQLIFAGVAPRQITTNLLTAAIVASGASQCGDMMQDLRTSYLLRVPPRKAFVAQCIGICIGILTCVPIYKLYDAAYHIGDEALPAPSAHAWKAVAEILSKGFSALPKNCVYGIIIGVCLGALFTLAYKLLSGFQKTEYWAQFIPSALAFGIGMIVPPKQTLTMFIGSIIFVIWRWAFPKQAQKYFFSISSGMIAGEGLIGLFIAVLKLFDVQPLIKPREILS